MKKVFLTLCVSLPLLGFPFEAQTQTVMYIDDGGNIHHVSSVSAVPRRYQAQVMPTQDVELDPAMQHRLYQEYQQRRMQEMRSQIRGDDVRQAQRERERREQMEQRERMRLQRQMEREQRRAERQQEKELKRRQRMMLQAGVDPRIVFADSLPDEMVPGTPEYEDES